MSPFDFNFVQFFMGSVFFSSLFFRLVGQFKKIDTMFFLYVVHCLKLAERVEVVLIKMKFNILKFKQFFVVVV